MSILSDKHAFYSYWDVYGQGINKDYLTTYSKSIIFDSYNRSFYTEGKAFGNHEMGTYHGEIFNDFEYNHAYGNYSSASGTHVISYNQGEYGVGHYNLSQKNKTLFTVGNGTSSNPSNAFEIHFDNSSYARGDMYVDGTAYVAKNSYIDKNVYVKESTYITGSSYINGNEKIKGKLTVLNGSDISGISYMNGTAYMMDGAYIDSNGYVSGDLWVQNVNVLDAYSYIMAYLGSYVGQTMKNAVKTMGLGQYFLWVGKTIDLPIASERYDNVIYVVVDEMPDLDRWYTDVDFDSLVFADSPSGAGNWILTADDPDNIETNDRVLRHNGIPSDLVR